MQPVDYINKENNYLKNFNKQPFGKKFPKIFLLYFYNFHTKIKNSLLISLSTKYLSKIHFPIYNNKVHMIHIDRQGNDNVFHDFGSNVYRG